MFDFIAYKLSDT